MKVQLLCNITWLCLLLFLLENFPFIPGEIDPSFLKGNSIVFLIDNTTVYSNLEIGNEVSLISPSWYVS